MADNEVSEAHRESERPIDDDQVESETTVTPALPTKDQSAVRFDGAFVGISRSRLAAMVCKDYG